MINNLLKIIEEHSQKLVVENPNIPSDRKEEAAQSLANSIFDGLKEKVSQGNVTQLLDIFSQKETSVGGSTLGDIQNSAAGTLTQKLGLNPGVAGSVASSIIPSIMGMLGKKASDPNDNNFDFNGIFQSLGGGGGLDFNSIMKRLDDDNDGFGLDDITRLFSGNNGGIGGILGKIFG